MQPKTIYSKNNNILKKEDNLNCFLNGRRLKNIIQPKTIIFLKMEDSHNCLIKKNNKLFF
jgi:hypothetical protein